MRAYHPCVQLPSAKGYAMALRTLFPEYLGLFGTQHGYSMEEPTVPLFDGLEADMMREFGGGACSACSCG
jgi:hypothetical protein